MADLADLVTRAAAEAPERAALVEASGRALTWAELEDEVGRLATGLGAAGIVAGHRVLLALGNRLEFVTTYLAILRAQAVAVPVNPRASLDELARMLADSGSRLVVADAATLPAVRAALALVTRAQAAPEAATESEREALSRAASRIEVVALDETPGPGERAFADLRAEEARAGAAAPRPREARGAALHGRDVRTTAGGDAHPPGHAGQPRAGRAGSSRR